MTDPRDKYEQAIESRMAEVTKGCCMNDVWRGRLCQMHDAYEDGLYDAMPLIGSVYGSDIYERLFGFTIEAPTADSEESHD